MLQCEWWLQVGGLLVRALTPTPGAEAASCLLTFSDTLFCQGSHKPFRFRGLGTGSEWSSHSRRAGKWELSSRDEVLCIYQGA